MRFALRHTLRTALVASAADAISTEVARMLAAKVGANSRGALRQRGPQLRRHVEVRIERGDDGLRERVTDLGVVEHRPDRLDVRVRVEHEGSQPQRERREQGEDAGEPDEGDRRDPPARHGPRGYEGIPPAARTRDTPATGALACPP